MGKGGKEWNRKRRNENLSGTCSIPRDSEHGCQNKWCTHAYIGVRVHITWVSAHVTLHVWVAYVFTCPLIDLALGSDQKAISWAYLPSVHGPVMGMTYRV